MRTKIHNFLLAGTMLFSAQAYAANFNINKGDGAVDFGDLTGSYSFPDNIGIYGPTDDALSIGDYVEISGNLSMNGRGLYLNSGAAVKSVGNYSMGSGGLNVYNSTNSSQGTTSLLMAGAGASSRLTITLSAESNVGKDGGTGSSFLEFGGYTTVTTNTNIRLDVGNTHNVSQKAAGNSTLRISGEDNSLSIYSFNIGDQNGGAVSGAAMVEIIGSTHTIDAIAAFRLTAGSGSTADNIVGGALKFVADANGVSAINVGTVTQSMTGVILLELDDFIIAAGETQDIMLISYSGLQGVYQTWLDTYSDTRFKATGADGDVTLEARNDGLYAVYSTVIPEPSTYAIMLGAFAFAFSAYRRLR